MAGPAPAWTTSSYRSPSTGCGPARTSSYATPTVRSAPGAASTTAPRDGCSSSTSSSATSPPTSPTGAPPSSSTGRSARPGPSARPGARRPADRHRRVPGRRAPAPVAGRFRLRKVRTWWQMTRPVAPDEASLTLPPTTGRRAVRFRLVRRTGTECPTRRTCARSTTCSRAPSSITSTTSRRPSRSSCRLREDPATAGTTGGWPARRRRRRPPVGTLLGSVSESTSGPHGSYVEYLGVLEAARGRGVAKGC